MLIAVRIVFVCVNDRVEESIARRYQYETAFLKGVLQLFFLQLIIPVVIALPLV